MDTVVGDPSRRDVHWLRGANPGKSRLKLKINVKESRTEYR